MEITLQLETCNVRVEDFFIHVLQTLQIAEEKT